jgi:tetratricopeptide (TPR) repeat protein
VITPAVAATAISTADSGNEPAAWLSIIVGYLVGTTIAVIVARGTTDSPKTRDDMPPQQLPAAPPLLLGRSNEIGEAVGYLRVTPEHSRRVVVISGPPGIGKTSLALHVAHHIAVDYPDGQLYANLDARGRDPEDVVRRTLTRFLEALDSSGGRPPSDLEGCRQAFEQVCATKRLLVFLDDLSGVDPQALIPDGALGATVITSRRPLPELDPQLPVLLDPLSEDAAVELLAHIVGSDRVAENADSKAAAVALVKACAQHPLALQIAGAALVARPSAAISLVVARTQAGSVAQTEPRQPENTGYRSALGFSYELLTQRDQDAVLSLGRLERRFQPWMLALEANLDEDQARALADRLSATQYVERSSIDAAGVPVYETVEHVQDFARLRAGKTSQLDTPYSHDRTLVRNPSEKQRVHMYDLLDQGKLSVANTAARDALALAREQGQQDTIGLALAALAELRAEVGGTDEVVDLAQQAWQQQDDATRARVSRVMGHIQRRVRQLDIAELNLVRAAEYADAADDVPEKIRILTELALVHRLSGRPSRALSHTAAAMDLARQRRNAGMRYRPRILLAEGMTLTKLRRADQAAERFGEARAVAAELNFDLWLSWVDYREAQMRLQTEDHENAQELAVSALARFTQIRHRYGAGHCRLLLGRVYARDQQFTAARTVLEDALETFRNCGDRFIEGQAAAELASVHLAEGSLPQAAAALERAKRLKTGQRYWRTSLQLAAARAHRSIGLTKTNDNEPASTSIVTGF